MLNLKGGVMKYVKKITNSDISQLKNMSVSDMSDLIAKYYLGQMLLVLKVLGAMAIISTALIVISGFFTLLGYLWDALTKW